MPRTQILPDRSDNYRPSTTDQQNHQLFSTRSGRSEHRRTPAKRLPVGVRVGVQPQLGCVEAAPHSSETASDLLLVSSGWHRRADRI